MDTRFMNSKIKKTYDPHWLTLNIYETNLKRSNKHVALSNLKICCKWKLYEKSRTNNKFKISAPVWRII